MWGASAARIAATLSAGSTRSKMTKPRRSNSSRQSSKERPCNQGKASWAGSVDVDGAIVDRAMGKVLEHDHRSNPRWLHSIALAPLSAQYESRANAPRQRRNGP